ncbi:MAG: cysteine synthase A [Deltaproteobacteria bacterium]|nr:MAG: cysteine synthase A [Deltaproteobacteria bacterium]
MTVYDGIHQTIGHTPLIRLKRISQNLDAALLVKAEFFNPLGSVKDRTAAAMIAQAEADGLLCPGGRIIEPTSGNTGIALAFICAEKGYDLTLTMPETMSDERKKLLTHLGARLELTPGDRGMNGAIERAQALVDENPGAFMPDQFSNPVNPQIHECTTAEEIWADTEGRVDVFVSGVGTGGTLTGVARALKKKNPSLVAIAVEPAESAVISGKSRGDHGIQGLGAGFIPKNLHMSLVDAVITITTDAALSMARRLAAEEGILCGISSGAAVAACVELAGKSRYQGKQIVTLLPSTGERYITTPLFG